MSNVLRRLALLAAVLILPACAIPKPTALPVNLTSPFPGYSSELYRDSRMWLCRPDLPSDACRVDLSATELRPDGSRAVVPYAPAAAPAVDCFYVYPTVDLSPVPGNHDDFEDRAPMQRAVVNQAARFGEACRVFAPLYRQITIGTYFWGEEQREERLAVAFSDVADAFLHYMGQYNQGRKVVLIGHSQGAEMVVRLLRRFFDGDPAMRARLLAAMPIGGRVDVPKGRVSGGTFQTIPICTRDDEPGCVVAYRSHLAGSNVVGWELPKAGDEAVCVNPAAVGSSEARPFSRSYFPAQGVLARQLNGLDGVTTPFVVLRDYYQGACVEGSNGYRYLAVSAAHHDGDKRVGPVDLGAARFASPLGLHVLDFQFPLGDLIDLVKKKAAARGSVSGAGPLRGTRESP